MSSAENCLWQAADWRREVSRHVVESHYVWTTLGPVVGESRRFENCKTGMALLRGTLGYLEVMNGNIGKANHHFSQYMIIYACILFNHCWDASHSLNVPWGLLWLCYILLYPQVIDNGLLEKKIIDDFFQQTKPTVSWENFKFPQISQVTGGKKPIVSWSKWSPITRTVAYIAGIWDMLKLSSCF